MKFSSWKNNRAALAVIAAVPVAAVVYWVATFFTSVPQFSDVKSAHQPSEFRLLDRHGEIIHEQRVDFKTRTLDWVPLSDISPALVEAVVFAEDKSFWSHGGVNWLSLGAAVKNYILRGKPRGASTITMQLSGMMRGGKQRDFLGKAEQIFSAMSLERNWSKQQIIEAYLNMAGFRAELKGVGAMSKALFGKQPKAMDKVESMIAVALLKSPGAKPEDVAKLACLRAALIGETGICGAIHAAAMAALDGNYAIEPAANLAPHAARALMTKDGGSIQCTLDGAVQRHVVEALARNVKALNGRHVGNGSAIVLDNETGGILAYVGDVAGDSKIPGPDGAKARRQAGSSLKPFLYAQAIDNKLITAASLLDDSTFETGVQAGIYRPGNYDKKYRGLVPARMALANSLNIPATRLADIVGPDDFVMKLEALGFTGLKEGDHYGVSIALGAPEVSLLELANAYRTLANGGVWSEPRMKPDGASQPGRRVYSSGAAFIVADILSDRGARSGAFGLENPLSTSFWSAAKTGTSKDMRDNWCIGFTSKYTVGVWVGNFSGAPMHNVSGVSGAAPAWVEIIKWLNSVNPSSPPVKPDDVSEAIANATSGSKQREYFLTGTETASVPSVKKAGAVKIVYPLDGEVMAIDPDIPFNNQKVFFRSNGDSPKLTWILNGKTIASGKMAPWIPLRGQHELKLTDGKNEDAIRFVVK